MTLCEQVRTAEQGIFNVWYGWTSLHQQNSVLQGRHEGKEGTGEDGQIPV